MNAALGVVYLDGGKVEGVRTRRGFYVVGPRGGIIAGPFVHRQDAVESAQRRARIGGAP